jgi:enamine deaminase RidA (YjgF/YER057c/UK114 family)
MTMIKRLHPGPRFCKAVIANGIVTTAGITATNANADTVAQTTDILAQIDALLAEAGTSKANLLTVNIWLRDIAQFAQMNSVWDKWIDMNNLPVRATVEARLAAPELLVEIQVSATV